VARQPNQTCFEHRTIQSTDTLGAASACRILKVASITFVVLGGAAACLTIPLSSHKSFHGDAKHAVTFNELPDGWKQFVDSQGRTYYHHARSGKSQWERPEKEEWDRPEAWTPQYVEHPVLPKGWQKLVDEQGRTYYFDELTRKTQWERPDDYAVDASTCTYVRYDAAAIPGNNLEVSEAQTAESCQELCTSKQSCLAIEFATTRAAGSRAAVYAAGWCSLQSAVSGAFVAEDGYRNLDLYVKGDCQGISRLPNTVKTPALSPPKNPSSVPGPETRVQPGSSPPAVLQSDASILKACPPPQVKDASGNCVTVTSPLSMTFYMYRSQDHHTYPLENVNMADLAGAMWYLHREVVASVPRKFNVSRILRYMVTMQNTAPLYQRTHRQFAPFVAFDSGSAPGRTAEWERDGFNVGCQHVDEKLYSYFNLDGAPGRWYSLPGPCPDERVGSKTPACIAKWPGGACETAMVTGAPDCTYYTEFAGEILLDELEGIENYNTWWVGKDANNGTIPNGNIEYKYVADRGVGMDFWNFRQNKTACDARMTAVTKQFKRKYPDLPEALPDYPCML